MGDELVVHGPRALVGELRLPGDKGISHRALIAAAMADGTSEITQLAPGDDVAHTRDALRSLGVDISGERRRLTVVAGRGVDALREAASDIDCGNSGTTMRMFAGLLSARPFESVLTGDASLSSRPMLRVIRPLRELGADIEGADDGDHAPLRIAGRALTGARVVLDVASGQVKTAVMLAGLQASGETEVVEPAPSRDHTERLFAAIGAPVERINDMTVRVHAGAPESFASEIPGDPSSAAFFIVAATVTAGSHLVLRDVLLNPGRVAFIDVLLAMGARITVTPGAERLGEPVGDIDVEAAELKGTRFECTEPIIDEVPALAVAAAFADGVTEIHNAAELRVKESNRIATIEQELVQLGVGAEPTSDGLAIRGGRPRAATLKSHGDHRIALAAAVAANAIEGESVVRGWSTVNVSYPEFAADLERLTAGA